MESEIRKIRLAIHSVSFAFHRRYKEGFDFHALIEAAANLGVSGVHISLNDANYRWIGGTSSERLREVGEALRARGMFVEVDTSGTDEEHLIKLLDAARMLGADRLRTYVTLQGSPEEKARTTVRGLRRAAPIAADLGIQLLLENHEEFSGREIVHIMEEVDHPTVGALYDFGNSMMILEDPMVAAKAMAPFIRTVHLKDQILTKDPSLADRGAAENTIVCGVPIGRGNIDVEGILRFLLNNTDLNRVCIQSVYGYRAPISRNLPQLAEAERRYPVFAQETDLSDKSFCILDPEALSRTDPCRLLNYEMSAVALGVGKVREILANLDFHIESGGSSMDYRRKTG
ncbi:MAG: sugar phosphate isomerase/epimerase family protein [Alphaproteobacteria bacterium]|jgi:sugar phosphate isomerase/epimerase|nr:hypothetical protein [Rhodospirillaceae bacterium]MDP6405097.1 sugar phosphate isomerase/epimerase family protein [Alphaproteobacteria bacterium]|tara:strand:- start:764 stop:1795 length:1032 start_codon:yes stop_codon:yes gene_type:complete